MMFHIHSMFAMELLALVAGVALLIFVSSATSRKITGSWGIFIAWFVIIVSALSIICSVYQSISYWKTGYFKMEKNMMMMSHKMLENQQRNVPGK